VFHGVSNYRNKQHVALINTGLPRQAANIRQLSPVSCNTTERYVTAASSDTTDVIHRRRFISPVTRRSQYTSADISKTFHPLTTVAFDMNILQFYLLKIITTNQPAIIYKISHTEH
jgi:polygalacturonase